MITPPARWWRFPRGNSRVSSIAIGYPISIYRNPLLIIAHYAIYRANAIIIISLSAGREETKKPVVGAQKQPQKRPREGFVEVHRRGAQQTGAKGDKASSIPFDMRNILYNNSMISAHGCVAHIRLCLKIICMISVASHWNPSRPLSYIRSSGLFNIITI